MIKIFDPAQRLTSDPCDNTPSILSESRDDREYRAILAASEGNDLVLSRISDHIGWITLNKPRTLNALTLSMMRRLLTLITDWEKNPDIQYVVIQGNGPRSFCAGGDLRGVYQAYQVKDFDFLDLLFRTEYTFNAHLHAFSKPYLALMHGFVMGGGVGASVHGSHRVVTESTLFAMPETSIGYFPDVGGTYFLNQCPAELGLYIGLTGAMITGADALYTGLATHYMDESDFAALSDAIAAKNKTLQHSVSDLLPQKEAFSQAHDAKSTPSFLQREINQLLNSFQKTPPPSELKNHQDFLKRCFLQPSVEDIFHALDNEPSSSASHSFAVKTLKTLKLRSPLSLKITFQQLTEGRDLSFEQAIKREFAMSQNFLHQSDFIEGIRTAIIDKDRSPQWRHTSLEEITSEEVEAYFQLPEGTDPL